MNEELSHTEDMTIEDFLSGATAYEIGDGSIRKVVGRPVHTTSGNSVKWRKNCMRNGMKKL